MAEQLADYEEYNRHNWDGYDAAPIVPETLRIARVMAELLSGEPDIATGGDGTIGFEWVSPAGDCKIFMDVGEKGISLYAKIGEQFFTRCTDKNGDRT